MTSTSFNSPQSCCHELFRNTHETSGAGLVGPTNEHAAEARRMRAFAGQRKFQAPVADDFYRGMLADGQSYGGNSLKHTGLINSLAAWWRRHTLD